METGSEFIIGLHTTGIGRWIRLILGIVLLAAALSAVFSTEIAVGPVMLYLILILGIYFLAYVFLGERLLTRTTPWIGTLLLVVPAIVIPFVSIIPASLRLAMLLYIGLSLLSNFYLRYGGCEVLSLPTLIFKRRYRVYCPTNTVEVVEEAVAKSRGKMLKPSEK